jgi:hypothetical protein
MSAYKLDDVIQKWSAGKLTTEQAIGQILQLIQERDKRLQELEGRVSALRRGQNRDSEPGPPDQAPRRQNSAS